MSARVDFLARLPVRAVLDGELVALDDEGKPDFSLLCECVLLRPSPVLLVSRERNSENLMVKRKNSASAEIVSEVRNTLESPRGVVAVRLSDSERERIARAAEARNLAFSSFVRWASLQAASDQLLRQKSTPEPDPGEHEPVVIGDTEQRVHYVDGEPVLR
jgi:hypothetical protein